MLIRKLFDENISTYTYLVADEETKDAVLIDPMIDNVERDLQLIRDNGLTLKYCLQTHINGDSISATDKLREITDCLSIIPIISDPDYTNIYIADGQVLYFGEVMIEAIAGHTDSHMAYLVNNYQMPTGNAVLISACGQTDFQASAVSEK